MKYILSILLGCLMYSAQGQTTYDTLKKIWDPQLTYEAHLWFYCEMLDFRMDRMQHRLDSLTHALQTMHDSLIWLTKHNPEFGAPLGDYIDLRQYPPATIYLDNRTPWEVRRDDSTMWAGYSIDSTGLAPRPDPKKKRRKG